MRAQTQKATINVTNGSGTLTGDVPLDFDASDVIASTSTSDGQTLLQFNLMSLLAKLDGTLYGQVLGQFLNDGNYTLSIVKTSGADLPLQTDAGQAINGITVGLPITSAAINFVPQLVFGPEIDNAKLELDMPPQTVFELGQFLLDGAGLDASSTRVNSVQRFALSDANGSQDLINIWFLQPVNGQGTLGLRDPNTGAITTVQDAQYQVLGSEKIYGLAYADLGRLFYIAPSADADTRVNVRFLLEDQQHAFSTIQSIAIDLQPGLQQSSLVTEGQELALQSPAYAITVESLPTQGKVYSVQGESRTELKLGDVVAANAQLVYVGPAVDASSQAPAGQWSVRGFDPATDTYVTTTRVLNINHLPSISVSSASPDILSEDAITASTVQITLADEDGADTARINLNGWTAGQDGVYTQSLQYGVATLSPVSGQAGQYTLSYLLDARSQALGVTLADDPLTLTVLDNEGTSRQTTVTFKVQGIDDKATFAAAQDKLFDTVSIAETNAVQTFTGQVLVSDVDSATAVVAQETVGTYGTFSIATNGAWTYTTKSALDELKATDKPSEKFTIVTADGTSKDITVNITGTNDAPTVASTPANTPLNSTLSISLASLIDRAVDPDNAKDDLTISGITVTDANSTASVSVSPDGKSVLVNTGTQALGSYINLSYIISDGIDSSTATIVVYVGDNNAPTGENATLSTNEDIPLGFSAGNFGFNDGDAGQYLFAVRIDSLPDAAAGSLKLNGINVTAGQVIAAADIAQLTFVPAANASGSASFTFSVQDSAGAFAVSPSTMTIDVTPVKDAPTEIILSANSLAENQVVGGGVKVGDITIIDPDTTGNNNTLSVSDTSNFEIRDNALYFKGASLDFETTPSYSVTITATDGQLITARDFTINVTNVNEAPTNITLSATRLTENVTVGNGIVVGTIGIDDPDASGNVNALSLTGTDADSFEIRGNQLVFKGNAANFETNPSYNIGIVSTDGELVTTVPFVITVDDVNEAPEFIALNNQQAILENTTTDVVVGTIVLTDPDNNNSFPSNVLTLGGADKDLFRIDGNQLVFKANPSVDFETRRSYSVTVVANAGTPQAASQAFTINVTNVIDQLTLDSAYVTVHDVDHNNEATAFSVLGVQTGDTLTLDLSAGQAGTALNRSNILQLFDGNPQTGRSPTLQFALKDTHDVPLGLSTVGVQFSIQNDRLASLTLAADFDVQIELVRDNSGQLQIELPPQTVQIALSAAGMPVTTVQVSNLSPDMFELVSGDNGTPSLSLKIDSLLDKAIGNTLALGSLSDQGALTLAAGLVMGLVGGRSVGDLLSLLKDSVDLSGELPDVSITRLLQLVQDTVTLPPALQNLSIGQLLSTAASAFNLDSSLTIGQLIGVLQDTFVLPKQFDTLTLADLQSQFLGRASSNAALDNLKSVALAMLQEVSPNAQLSDVSSLTLSGLLDKIATSTLANESLDSLGSYVNAQISGYNGVALIKDLAIVVNGLYGDKSALQVLQLLQESATLPEALAGLEVISLADLLDLSGLALAAADLLGPENLSIAGLTQLIYDAVTLDGQLNLAQINQAIDTLDAALNLQSLLGEDYSLRELFSDLSDPKVEFQPLIEIASKVLFSSDGQASIQLDLPDSLALQGVSGQNIQRVVVNTDLSDTPNTAGEFTDLSYLVPRDDAQFDLGQFLLMPNNFVDPQGHALAGVLIDQPWVGELMLAFDNAGETMYTPLFVNDATVAQVSLAQLSQLVFMASTTPDGQVLDLAVELQLRAIDHLGAIGQQQQLQLI